MIAKGKVGSLTFCAFMCISDRSVCMGDRMTRESVKGQILNTHRGSIEGLHELGTSDYKH